MSRNFCLFCNKPISDNKDTCAACHEALQDEQLSDERVNYVSSEKAQRALGSNPVNLVLTPAATEFFNALKGRK